jgi:hypothetical protein
VEETIDQVGNAGSKAVDFTSNIFKVLSEMVKPGVDAAVPILQSASQEALQIASPVVSDVSKQAKEALQSAGIDPSPVFSAAKVFLFANFEFLCMFLQFAFDLFGLKAMIRSSFTYPQFKMI